MNRYLFITCLVICTLQIVKAQDPQWNPTKGPYGGPANAMAVDRQGDLFVTAGNKGIYRSTDGGDSWTWSGLALHEVTSLAIDSSGGILAACNDSLFASTNKGETWDRISFLGWSRINSIAIAPDGRLVIATGRILDWTTNHGSMWHDCSPSDNYSSLIIDTANTWISGSANGIRRSTDNGLNWTSVATGIQVVSLFKNSSGVYFAGTGGFNGIYRSTDDGFSWSPSGLKTVYTINTFAEASQGVMLVGVLPLDPSMPGGVYRSSDGGSSWVESGLQNTEVHSLIRVADQTIIATSYLGLHRSIDNGATWQDVNIGIINTTITGIFTPAPSTVLAATDVGIFRTSDGGANWKNCYPDLNPPWVVSVAVDADQRLFFGTMLFSPLGGVYRSVDSGATWLHASGSYIAGMYDGISGLVVAPNGHVFTGFGSLSIFRSTDHGDTWERVNRTPSGGILKMLAADSAGGVFAALGGKGLLRTTDDGTTWAKADSGISNKNLSCIAVKSTTWIFTGGAAGNVYRSSDRGASWDSVRTGLPRKELKSLAVASNGDILASFFGAGVYRSTNDGLSWAPSGDGLPSADVNVLAGSSDGTIYAGTSTYGIFSSKGSLVSVPPRPERTPRGYSLGQNYPNPFNPTTAIRYQVSGVSQVKLIVFDLLGRQVAVLVNETKSPGSYDVRFDGSGLASGIYLYRLQVRPLDSAIGRDSKGGAGGFMQTRKMMLVK